MHKEGTSIEMKANKDAFEDLVDDYENIFLYPAEHKCWTAFRISGRSFQFSILVLVPAERPGYFRSKRLGMSALNTPEIEKATLLSLNPVRKTG